MYIFFALFVRFSFLFFLLFSTCILYSVWALPDFKINGWIGGWIGCITSCSVITSAKEIMLNFGKEVMFSAVLACLFIC